MEINTVSIIGLGALGILFGKQLKDNMGEEKVRIIANKDRIERYKRDKIYCNSEQTDFYYVDEEEKNEPADLVIFCVKYGALDAAISAMRNQIGDNTIILSALNGVSSEERLEEAFGKEKVLYCVAQGMDAVKTSNHLTYIQKGMLCFGEKDGNVDSPKVRRVAEFFDKVNFPYEVVPNMYKRMWSKLMLNVGVNQTVALSFGNYEIIQKEGEERDYMISAMREVMALAPYVGIELTEDDLNYWLDILDTLNPEGQPSMRQDMGARVKSEVELFAGTVIKLGKKYGVDTPVNQKFYEQINEVEDSYDSQDSQDVIDECGSIIGDSDGPTAIFLAGRSECSQEDRLEYEKWVEEAASAITSCPRSMKEVEEYIISKYNAKELPVSKEKRNEIKTNVIFTYYNDILTTPEPIQGDGIEEMKKNAAEYGKIIDKRFIEAYNYPEELLNLDIHSYEMDIMIDDANYGIISIDTDRISGYIQTSFTGLSAEDSDKIDIANNKLMDIHKDIIIYKGVSEEDITNRSNNFWNYLSTMPGTGSRGDYNEN